MPTTFTHIFVAEVLAKTGFGQEKMPMRFWVLTAVCSILPDIDIVGFYLGIKYGHVLGHRGFFHSLSFALFVDIAVLVLPFPAVTRFSRKWWAMLAFFFVVTASHGLLDSMTEVSDFSFLSTRPVTTCRGGRFMPLPCASTGSSAKPASKS
jgi:inner membrane protein